MIHAITTTWAFDEAKKREALPRRCPKCRREQVAEEKKLNAPITCEKCGALLPPRAEEEAKKRRLV
jgi:ribosomal protein S27E